MLRCRRRNTLLYLGITLVSLFALFQSFILDVFRQSVPRRLCNSPLCLVGGVNLRDLTLPPSGGGGNQSYHTGRSRDFSDINMAASVSNLTRGQHGAAAGDVGEIKSADGRTRNSSAAADGVAVITGGGNIGGKTVSSAPAADAGIPRWQRRLLNNSSRGGGGGGGPARHHRYFLVELLQVRIYAHDKAKWTIRELKQWMHFLFLAGVEHIYLCDHYQKASERLYEPLRKYITLKLVTYISWRTIAHPMTAQVECYQYIIDRYGNQTRFQMAIDMDEYPFSPVDFGEGFLPRYLKNFSSQGYGHRISEISMNNYLMLGQGDRGARGGGGDMVIARVNRMTPKPANHLVKPIFKPDRVRAGLHHNYLRRGIAVYANDSALRMLHYWGARLQDWGPDTRLVRNMTVQMDAMRDRWAARVRRSLRAFGENDAFSSATGP